MSNAKNEMPAGAELSPYDTADYLKSPEQITAYLEAVFTDYGDDAAMIAKALGAVARAQGMQKIATATGLTREGLYQALSGKSKPSFDTILKVMRAVGVKLMPASTHAVPEAVIFEGQVYSRATLGEAYGWTGDKSEVMIVQGATVTNEGKPPKGARFHYAGEGTIDPTVKRERTKGKFTTNKLVTKRGAKAAPRKQA
jgi:probable addiction module antidote protein